eukprot:12210282-Alexandrium_andersonii.AAC.1
MPLAFPGAAHDALFHEELSVMAVMQQSDDALETVQPRLEPWDGRIHLPRQIVKYVERSCNHQRARECVPASAKAHLFRIPTAVSAKTTI